MRELSLNIMDVVQNSISAKATEISIAVQENTMENTLSIKIGDNGKGMTAEQVKKVQDPFYTTRTTRKVGLGIPLFKMAAEQTGGTFRITSAVNKGTTVLAVFDTSSLDMTPLGDINDTVHLLVMCNPNLDFTFTHQVDDQEFTLDTKEMREMLGHDVPLNHPDVTLWIKSYLNEQDSILFGGATNK